jgi:hypothetical protein
MSEQTEEVRTVFTWDTAGVETGGRKIERAFGGILEGERRVKTNLAGLAGDLTHATSGMDVLAAAGSRLANVFKVGAGAAIGLEVAATIFSKINDAADEANQATEKLIESATAASRLTPFASASQGTDSLAGQIGQMRDLQKQSDASSFQNQPGVWGSVGKFLGNVLSSPMVSLPGTAVNIWGQNLQDAFEGQGNAEQLTKKLGASQENKLRGEYSKAVGDERDVAQIQIEGNIFELKRKQLAVQKEMALAKAKEIGASQADLALVGEKFDLLQKNVDAEQRVSDARFLNQSANLGIEAGNGPDWKKRLDSAKAKRAESQKLIKSGDLTQPEDRAERLSMLQDENTISSVLHGEYLDKDGRPKSRVQLGREHRAERQRQRRVDNWDKHHDENGKWIQGKVTDGLSSGPAGDGLSAGPSGDGLKGASMATWDQKDVFRQTQPDKPKPASDSKGGKTLEDLWNVLDQRLPAKST